MPVNRLTIESATQTSTHTSAGVDVSTITGDYTIKLLVSALAGTSRIAIEESTNNFATTQILWVENLQGPIPGEGARFSFKKRQAAGTGLVGKVGAKLRVNIQELNPPLFGPSPSVTYEATVEY